MKIQVIKSPGGIEAWLVEAHNNPLLAMKFAFEGGNSQDPESKDGVVAAPAPAADAKDSTAAPGGEGETK